ncbi:MAG: glycosyltransferase family 9 protein [Gammaproteobacteria bacterium]
MPTEQILVIRHGAFGDLVQCSGALADLRAFHADASLTLLTGPAFRTLMSRCPQVDRIITDARLPLSRLREQLALRRALRHAQFARVYDLQNSDRSALYRWLFLPGIPWSVATGRVPETEPDVQRYAAQLQAAGIPVRHTLEPDVTWMADDVSRLLEEAGVRKPYIALIPGCAARHPHKRWPYYAQLAAGLLAEGYAVVTAPGPDELELCRGIPGHTLTGASGYLDWFQLAGVLKAATFVVGNDTGPSHVAACLGTPGLALFGPHTTPRRTGILRARFEAIAVADLTQLTPAAVLAAVLTRLNPADA